jgi:hypothetical protein
MITSFLNVILFAIGFVVILFSFVGYVLWQEKKDCEHKTQATFDSYHKKVCIDCGEEFSTTEIGK